VDSAVVKIDLDPQKNENADFFAVREAVRAGFSSRRKMLVNNLMNFYKLNRTEAESVLNSAGISLTARGETLSAEAYIRLAEMLKNAKR